MLFRSIMQFKAGIAATIINTVSITEPNPGALSTSSRRAGVRVTIRATAIAGTMNSNTLCTTAKIRIAAVDDPALDIIMYAIMDTRKKHNTVAHINNNIRIDGVNINFGSVRFIF